LALTRKVVTVLFCDVTGSTSLGESTDPEALLAAAGKHQDARAALEQALDRYERKRNLVLAARVRERLASLPA
jgi:class 3 adenylate cyclase